MYFNVIFMVLVIVGLVTLSFITLFGINKSFYKIKFSILCLKIKIYEKNKIMFFEE